MTRVEVLLSDEYSSQRFRDSDKAVVMEACLFGLQPITVSAGGLNREQALEAAAGKLEKILNRILWRLDVPKGRMSYGGERA